MFHLLIIGHGNLAKEIVNTAKMIMGDFDGVEVMTLSSDQNMDGYFEDVKTKCHERILDGGVLILTDLIGGSPFLAAARAYHEYQSLGDIEIVSGMNLAMVIEVIASKAHLSVKEGKELAIQTGRNGIKEFEFAQGRVEK